MNGNLVRILGLVPARGGSKGLPRKNIRELCGRPLLHYTIEAAFAAKRLTRVVLSTDDAEIAEVGRRCGVEVPFMRPADLARDDTPMLPVIQHAVRAVEADGPRFDAVCLLQPTNPLRTAEHIDACIELLDESEADAVMTVLRVPVEHNPHWVYFRAPEGELRLSMGGTQPVARRQELPEAFHREGSVYVTRRDVVMQQHSLYGRRVLGYEVGPTRSVNIDDVSDWARAERILGGDLEVTGAR